MLVNFGFPFNVSYCGVMDMTKKSGHSADTVLADADGADAMVKQSWKEGREDQTAKEMYDHHRTF